MNISTEIIPHELALGGVYMPPLLIAAFLGALGAVVTARVLNRYRLSRYFFYPPVVFLSLMVLYTVFIGQVLIGI